MRTSARRALRCSRKITLTGLLGFASSALAEAVHRRRIRLERRRGRDLHDLPGRRGPCQRPAHPSPAARRGRDISGHDPDRVPRSRGRARAPRHDQRRDRRAAAPAGGDRRRLPADRGALQCRDRSVPDGARRAAFLLCGAADAGARSSSPRRRTSSRPIRRSAAMRCSRARRSASVCPAIRDRRTRFSRRSAARTDQASKASSAKLASQCSPI